VAWDGVAWAVAGGEHTPELARVLAYAATGGGEGVVGINDLVVRALATPGAAVRIGPGAGVMINRYPGASWGESYIARNPTDTNVMVTASGAGSGRADMVVARMRDPQYPGMPSPPSVPYGPYVEGFVVQNVPTTATRISQINGGAGLPYPAVALARINLPANTSTITNSMITDLRKVVQPRRERVVRTISISAGNPDPLGATGTLGEPWPDQGMWNLDIPEWATRARITATWAQAWVPDNIVGGYVWVRVGTNDGSHLATQTTRYRETAAPVPRRSTLMNAGEIAIPESYRGTTQSFQMRGRVTEQGTEWPIEEGDDPITVDAESSIILDVEFVEQATTDS